MTLPTPQQARSGQVLVVPAEGGMRKGRQILHGCVGLLPHDLTLESAEVRAIARRVKRRRKA